MRNFTLLTKNGQLVSIDLALSGGMLMSGFDGGSQVHLFIGIIVYLLNVL